MILNKTVFHFFVCVLSCRAAAPGPESLLLGSHNWTWTHCRSHHTKHCMVRKLPRVPMWRLTIITLYSYSCYPYYLWFNLEFLVLTEFKGTRLWFLIGNFPCKDGCQDCKEQQSCEGELRHFPEGLFFSICGGCLCRSKQLKSLMVMSMNHFAYITKYTFRSISCVQHCD